MVGLIVAALLVRPTASPTPLKVIERVQASARCTLLHENVAPSVGAVLRNDIVIQQAGTSVDNMVRSINGLGGDSPYGNPGVALAQVQLLDLGGRLVKNIAAIDRRLADPRFKNLSDPEVAAIRESLEHVADQQSRLLNIIFSIAYSSHPADLRYYGDPVQDQIREAIRREPRGSVVSGDVFGPFERIANENIAQTRILENVAASQIVAMARSCGDIVVNQGGGDSAVVQVPSQPPLSGSNQTDAAAKAFYARLVRGSLDRSHLSPALSSGLTASFLETLSQELSALGAPAWQSVGKGTTPSGPVSVYRLSYGNGVTLYYGYGADSVGMVFALFVGTQRPPSL